MWIPNILQSTLNPFGRWRRWGTVAPRRAGTTRAGDMAGYTGGATRAIHLESAGTNPVTCAVATVGMGS
jgi:hypothetical protein